jgi:hypothetical protein
MFQFQKSLGEKRKMGDLVNKHFEDMEKAVSLRIRGKTPYQISRELGITRVEVDNLLIEWRELCLNDQAIVERTREALANTDIHYNDLIARGWEIIAAADDVLDSEGFDPKVAAQKTAAVKLIGDLEAKRFAMLKEMGAIDNSEMATQIAERERKEEIIVGILRDVVFKCPDCQKEVKKRLAQLNNEPIPVDVIQ